MPPSTGTRSSPNAAFTDFTALATSDIQAFLESTPYGGASFLSTYQSNGILFSGAVTHAAQTYRINPLVLLVAVEATGALLADATYPQPPAHVDYLFGCGCSIASDAGSCDPSAAGLDVQLACYANALRTSLDAITETGATAGGWAPWQNAKTLDGMTVTPVDDSTAALYQYDPLVGSGESGNSLFWSVWNEYTLVLAYSTPQGSSSAGTALHRRRVHRLGRLRDGQRHLPDRVELPGRHVHEPVHGLLPRCRHLLRRDHGRRLVPGAVQPDQPRVLPHRLLMRSGAAVWMRPRARLPRRSAPRAEAAVGRQPLATGCRLATPLSGLTRPGRA